MKNTTRTNITASLPLKLILTALLLMPLTTTVFAQVKDANGTKTATVDLSHVPQIHETKEQRDGRAAGPCRNGDWEAVAIRATRCPCIYL